MNDLKYQKCTRCVMDTTDPDIVFNGDGVCNHCLNYDFKYRRKMYSPEVAREKLLKLASDVKNEGKVTEYDCIIGLSGGIDSTYLAYYVKQKLGLRPLAIHLDNGWNSELSVKNISQIVKKLEIDLFTTVINWEEFKDLQISFLKASVIDTEMVTDHAIMASLYKLAAKHKVKNILLGTNRATEQILPLNWRFNKNDLVNIRDIHSKFGKVRLSTFPTLGLSKLGYYSKVTGIKLFSPLNLMNYDKETAKKTVEEFLSWRDPGGKHYESIFTRFYQGYILPKKFNVDKRKAHFSTLILSGQMSREDAIASLLNTTFEHDQIIKDYDYVIKKLDFTKAEFEEIMHASVKSHFDYKTDLESKLIYKVYPKIYPYYRSLRRMF